MVAIVDRRTALIGSIVSSTLCSSSVLVEDVAKFLVESTPREFRQAVQRSNHFLYRGNDEQPHNSMAGQVCSPEPDLLLPETYNDEKALEYFKCLEEYLTNEGIKARPSTGHVGTPEISQARQWGDVVSVWPLGDSLSFVYPKNSNTFFPGCTCGETDYVMDTDLDLALTQGHEVLFSSWYANNKKDPALQSSSFLIVPQQNDVKLKRLLESLQYGLN